MSRRPLTAVATVLVVAVAVAGAVESLDGTSDAAAAVSTPAGGGYTKVFADEFNGTSVNTAVWNYRTDVKSQSAQRPENVSVGNGVMTIHLRKQDFAGKKYTGGGLISKQAFRYGYYETRAKTHTGAGWHSAFWAMQGDGRDTFNTARRTEIDGFEADSHRPRVVQHNVIPWNRDGSTDPIISRRPYDVGFDTSAAWHVYGFDWREDIVRFYVDGRLAYTADYDPRSHTAHDYVNVWLTAIGYTTEGIGYTGPIDDSALPGTVEFDYLRYFQKDYYVDNDGPAAYGYRESGTWSTSTVGGFTQENSTRYSTAAGATATWRPKLAEAGTYGVYVYRTVDAGNDTASRINVAHAGGTATRTVNYTSGTRGWHHLGDFSFTAGTAGSVTLTRGNGNARADAVKFIRR